MQRKFVTFTFDSLSCVGLSLGELSPSAAVPGSLRPHASMTPRPWW